MRRIESTNKIERRLIEAWSKRVKDWPTPPKDAASEQAELVRQSALNVHLDIAHRGVGTASCGPDTLAKYLIGPGEYTFAYVVSYR